MLKWQMIPMKMEMENENSSKSRKPFACHSDGLGDFFLAFATAIITPMSNVNHSQKNYLCQLPRQALTNKAFGP